MRPGRAADSVTKRRVFFFLHFFSGPSKRQKLADSTVHRKTEETTPKIDNDCREKQSPLRTTCCKPVLAQILERGGTSYAVSLCLRVCVIAAIIDNVPPQRSPPPRDPFFRRTRMPLSLAILRLLPFTAPRTAFLSGEPPCWLRVTRGTCSVTVNSSFTCPIISAPLEIGERTKRRARVRLWA